MKSRVVSLIINMFTYVALQALVIVTVFLSGFGSKDKYTVYQWIIYFLYMCIHIACFIWLPLFRNDLPKKMLSVVAIAWLVTGLYIAF